MLTICHPSVPEDQGHASATFHNPDCSSTVEILEISKADDKVLQKPEDISEQQRIHRNVLRRARYAQMSPQRKELYLSQQQSKRAESKKWCLLQHLENTILPPQVNNLEGIPNIATISEPSTAAKQGHAYASFDTSNCISTFEIGSTSREYDAAKKITCPLVTSYSGTIQLQNSVRVMA